MKKTNKAVIVSIGSYGDFLPAIGFARELQQKNIAVCMIGYTVFAELAQDYGVEYHGVCSAQDYANMTSLRGSIEAQGETAEYHHFMSCGQVSIVPIFEQLLRMSAEHHLVVFSVGYSDGAVWACEETQSPLVRLSYSPADISTAFSERTLRDARHHHYESLCRQHRNAIRKSLLLPPRKETDWQYEFAATVCFYPACLMDSEVAKSTQNERFILGFPKHIIAIDSPTKSAPKYYDLLYTCGSAFSASMDELRLFGYLCEQLSLQGVFVSNNLDLPTSRLDNPWVDVVRNIDFAQVLPSVKLIFHHGGIGTIKDALFSQTAQLVLPRAFDQFYNAAMVESMGLGIQMDLADFLANKKALTLERVRALLQQKTVILDAIKALPLQQGDEDLERLVTAFSLLNKPSKMAIQ